jgi:FkbM family methyltransferase
LGFEKVIAIEPDSRASKSIEPSDGVELIDAVAASNEDERRGSVLLHLRASPDQNSLLEEHPIGVGGGVDAPPVASTRVKCVTLKTICPSGADFVKIDVEGAEESVLSACQEDGTWDRCVFLVECHDTFPAVEKELNRLGKTVTRIPHPFAGPGGAHVGHCWAVGTA